jgi:DNA repair exonuclease SbcCD ATPase subunit
MTDLTALRAAVKAQRSVLDKQAGEAMSLAKRGQAAEAERDRLRARLETCEKTCKLLTTIGEQEQDIARAQVEGLVTRALQVVFGEELSFRLKPGTRGNQAVLDLLLVSQYGGTTVETPVMEARGGGMAAVVGFALRLVILLLTPEYEVRRLLVLDETFAHVSASYEPRVAEFLREVADKAGVQVLLVTHSNAYGEKADSRYRLSLAGGFTEVHPNETE